MDTMGEELQSALCYMIMMEQCFEHRKIAFRKTLIGNRSVTLHQSVFQRSKMDDTIIKDITKETS